jgi:hypothetical protein
MLSAAVSLSAAVIVPARAQQVLAPLRASGQTVTPAFEGWYRNADGTYSISFGYYNRNSEEAVDIPIGPDNFISPGDRNQGQPTHFEPKRHWGVFAVKVPADFGDKIVTWTVNFRGKKYEIPGRLHPNWQIDALEGEASSNNTPPQLRFEADAKPGAGPAGAWGKPLTAQVGKPLSINAWATDDGRAIVRIASNGRAGQPVTLTWFKHQGPGAVTFSPKNPRAAADGLATVQATFSEPGEYILRLRANDASGVDAAGHSQCCWSNGFVKVTVSK